MLADEVTPREDGLRLVAASHRDRSRAPAGRRSTSQRAVDKAVSASVASAVRDDESPVHLARKFRSLAGFSEEEIAELVDTAAEAFAEAQAMQAAAAGERIASPHRLLRLRRALVLLQVHRAWAWGRHHRQRSRGRVGARRALAAGAAHAAPCGGSRSSSKVAIFVQAGLGVALVNVEKIDPPAVPPVSTGSWPSSRSASSTRTRRPRRGCGSASTSCTAVAASS